MLLTNNVNADYERSSLIYNDGGGLPDSGVGPYEIIFWFDVDKVAKYISSTELILYVDDINYPDEKNMVSFIEPDGTEHDLGFIETNTIGRTVVHISLEPGWIKTGTNTIRIDVKPGWNASVDDAKLLIRNIVWTRDNRTASK